MSKNIVQYIVLRRDLLTSLKWPIGALVAQGCHACTAVITLFCDDSDTKQYLADLDRMHKIVLEVPNEKTLVDLSTELSSAGIQHKLWIEQPENVPTCIAVKPYPKDQIHIHMKKFKLFK